MNSAEHECLRRIRLGLIRLDEQGVVESFSLSNKRWKKKRPRSKHVSDVSDRARYTFRDAEGRKVNVYANRLMWMLKHRREIPDCSVIDHEDENRHNNHPDNLVLMKLGESHRQGGNKRADEGLEKLQRWFRFVGEHGREPMTEHEVLYVETGF